MAGERQTNLVLGNSAGRSYVSSSHLHVGPDSFDKLLGE